MQRESVLLSVRIHKMKVSSSHYSKQTFFLLSKFTLIISLKRHDYLLLNLCMFFPQTGSGDLWPWRCGAPLWRDQRHWMNLLVWNAWKCPGLLLNGRVGRTTGRQMFKQCVHSPLVRRGPPCLAAFKADTVGWRLGASCATKLLCRRSVGQTGQILHIKAKETEGGDGAAGVMSTPLHRLDNRDDGSSVMIEELNFQYINILQVS